MVIKPVNNDPFKTGLPPISWISTFVLALIVTGGVYLAAFIPRHPPLAIPTALLALSVLLLIVNVILLIRIPVFAWKRFLSVLRWALLAYCIIAGMLEYVFIYDGTRGSVLVILSAMLAVFAVDVPIIIAFTVARFES